MDAIIKGVTQVLEEMPRHQQLSNALKTLGVTHDEVAKAKGLDLGYLRHILAGRQPSEAYLTAVEEYVSEILNNRAA